MKKEYNLDLKKIIPHIIAVGIFITISVFYFSPVMDGKVLYMPDIIKYKGMSKESKDFKEMNDGKQTLWTGTSFCGMPTYQTGMQSQTNLVKYIDKFIKLGLPRPMDMLFLYLIGFYILLLTLKIDYRVAIVGAMGYAFSSYFFIILEAGHTSKALAIGYLPLIVSAVLYTYRSKKWLLGAVFTSLFVALQLYSNHYQITYYTAILLAMIGLTQFVKELRNKSLSNFFKRSAFLILAGLLALGTNYTVLSTTMEYSKVSQRGSSELTTKKGEKKDEGMSTDYITQYSYGIDETMTFLIPNFKGGAFKERNYWGEFQYFNPKNPNQKVPFYGPGAPTYVGAIIFFFFFLGLFYVKSSNKYWLVASTVLTVMLGWGHNLPAFTDFFIDYFPMYDKFRAVTMIMIIAQFSIALLAVMALNQFIKDDDKVLKEKKLKNSFYIIGGVTLLFALVPSYFLDFVSPAEKDYLLLGGNMSELMGAISSRQDVLQSDAWRSFTYIFLAVIVLWMFIKNIIKKQYVILLVGALILFDMWSVNKRYLNEESFVNDYEFSIKKDKVDAWIIKNNFTRSRVFDKTLSTFSDAKTSYFHNSLGGYSAAKIKRYQQFYETYFEQKSNSVALPKVLSMLNCGWIKSPMDLNKPPNQLKSIILDSDTSKDIEDLADKSEQQLKKMILDLDYIDVIYSNNRPLVITAIPTSMNLGNAWFVSKTKIVDNANEELESIASFNPLTTAIIDKKFSINQSDFNYDSSSKIKLDIKNYKPNHLIYNIDKPSAFNQLAVFSEVYYEKGWNAYIDGKIVPHFRANYILRAMIVPAGTKKIEFKFEPTSFSNGENIALASSIILLLLLAFVSFKGIKSE